MSVKNFQRVQYSLYYDCQDNQYVQPRTLIRYDDQLGSLVIQNADGCLVNVTEQPELMQEGLATYNNWEYPEPATIEQVIDLLKKESHTPLQHLAYIDIDEPLGGDYYDLRPANSFEEDDEITLDDIRLIAYEVLDIEKQLYTNVTSGVVGLYRNMPFLVKRVFKDDAGNVDMMLPFEMSPDDEDYYRSDFGLLEVKASMDEIMSSSLDEFSSLSYAALIRSLGDYGRMVYRAFAAEEDAVKWVKWVQRQSDLFWRTSSPIIKPIKK